jgi:hypothetical protein
MLQFTRYLTAGLTLAFVGALAGLEATASAGHPPFVPSLGPLAPYFGPGFGPVGSPYPVVFWPPSAGAVAASVRQRLAAQHLPPTLPPPQFLGSHPPDLGPTILPPRTKAEPEGRGGGKEDDKPPPPPDRGGPDPPDGKKARTEGRPTDLP